MLADDARREPAVSCAWLSGPKNLNKRRIFRKDGLKSVLLCTAMERDSGHARNPKAAKDPRPNGYDATGPKRPSNCSDNLAAFASTAAADPDFMRLLSSTSERNASMRTSTSKCSMSIEKRP